MDNDKKFMLGIRTLSRFHYCDKTEILPHAIFAILTEFLEEECTPPNDIVDWEGSGHTVKVNGVDINVRREMQSLHDWWHEKYLKNYPAILEDLWDRIYREGGKHKDVPRYNADGKICSYEWVTDYDSAEHEAKSDFLVNLAMDMEARIQDELQEKCCRVVMLIPFLWT